MKRRLNIAAGTIHRPRLLLLDEPTVGVDPQSRERIYAMIDELRAEGVSILYTTHYMEEAERLCDRIAIIDHGKVIAEGTQERARARDAPEGARPDDRVGRGDARGPCGTASRARGASLRAEGRGPVPVDDPAREIPEILDLFRVAGAPVRDLHAEDRDARGGLPSADGPGSARMILAVARTHLARLRRDRAGFMLAFVVPIVFFSVFALVFGGPRGATRRIPVAVVDEDGSENSRRFVEAFGRKTGSDSARRPAAFRKARGPRWPSIARSAEAAVRNGDASGRARHPDGIRPDTPIQFGPSSGAPRLLLLADSADPVAPQVVAGLLQKVALTAMPDVDGGDRDRADGPLGRRRSPTSRRRASRTRWTGSARALERGPASAGAAASAGLVGVEVRDVLGAHEEEPGVGAPRGGPRRHVPARSPPRARAARSSRSPRAARSTASSGPA